MRNNNDRLAENMIGESRRGSAPEVWWIIRFQWEVARGAVGVMSHRRWTITPCIECLLNVHSRIVLVLDRPVIKSLAVAKIEATFKQL